VVALVVYFALTNERLQGALTLALTATPVAAALYHARHLGTLFNATTSDAQRSAQGHAFGRWALAAICLAIVAQTVAALVTRAVPLAGRRRRVVGALTLAVAVVVVSAAGLAFAARYGGVGGLVDRAFGQFTSSSSSATLAANGAGRLLALGDDGRIAIAREGLASFPHHPLAGTGAGTFRFTNYLYRPNASFLVKHAHNQWINVLSELGLVGLVLFVLAIGGLLVAALRPLGRAARGADRGLLAAMQAAIVAFVAHMTIDWDWDMAAAALAFLLLAGVAAAYLRGRRADLAAAGSPDASDAPAARAAPRALRLGTASRVLASGVLVIVALSFLSPYLSQSALARAIVLASGNRTAAAAVQAHRAHRFDPLAVDPLFTLALIEQQEGQASAAVATLEQAVRLQPQNYLTYYELGDMQLNVLGRRTAAAASLRHALALNPNDDNSSADLSAALAAPATP
jgi:O-antigen ligase